MACPTLTATLITNGCRLSAREEGVLTMTRHSGTDRFTFEIDLGDHEIRRRTEILRALGPDWDPIAVLAAEAEAYELLYSGLDREQMDAYQSLVRAGVLDQSVRGSDAA
jgi:hypothetical protein